MELELGLKITRTRDDLLSSSEIQLAKDRSGPIFLSRETESMFILTAYLKGYRKENIDISINEDGTQIAISGERPVQEMSIRGWIMIYQSKESLKGFGKVFRIPDGVILDRIKARFQDEESVLTVVMPKRLKGIFGDSIKEVEDMESVTGTSESMQTVDDNVTAGDIGGERLEGDAIDSSLDNDIQAVEENNGTVENETETRETEPAQGILDKESDIKQIGGIGQARDENADKTAKSKATMPELPKKEGRRKLHKETDEAAERSMTQINKAPDVAKEIRELEEDEAPPTSPPSEETKEHEYQLQGETDKQSQPTAPESEETRTKDVHQPEDQTTKQEAMDGELDKKDQAIEENVDTAKNETEKEKAMPAQRRLDEAPTIEQTEETDQAREENLDSTTETKATMPSEVPKEESRRKLHEENKEPDETNKANINEVVDVPEEIREPEEAEAPLTLPPVEETKEQKNQLQGEIDKTSQATSRENEETKTKDLYQPEEKTTKQEAMDGRSDEEDQVSQEIVDKMESETEKRRVKPAQRRVEEEPTIEQMEGPDQAREENIESTRETKATMPSEVPEKESRTKLYEKTKEPEETNMAEINKVVDVPEVRDFEEAKAPLSFPPLDETKEQKSQLHGENVEPIQAAAPKIEEMQSKDVHQPEEETTKQEAINGRFDEKDQAVKENVNTVQNETENRNARPTQRRLDEEPTIEKMEITSQVREENIDKTVETNVTMPRDVPEKESRQKLFKEAEEQNETNMSQTHQVVDVPGDLRESEEVEAPPTITETKEQEKQLQGETEKVSLATPPKIEETKTKDVLLPEYQKTKPKAMGKMSDHKDQAVEEIIDRVKNEKEKGKAKKDHGKHDEKQAIEHTEEASRAREENADKIAESKATMPSKVLDKERRRKLHEEVEEPKTSMTEISQVVDVPEEIRDFKGVEAPPTIPPYEETKEHENQSHGKTDKPSQVTAPKYEETKTKDAHQPEDQIMKQDAMDGQSDDKDQVVNENVDTSEHETEEVKSGPTQRRLNKKPHGEQMEETNKGKENVDMAAERNTTAPDEVPQKECRMKFNEESEELDGASVAHINERVDVLEEVQRLGEAEAPPSILPFKETREQENQLLKEADSPSSKTPQVNEEMKTTDIHHPDNQTKRQESAEIEGPASSAFQDIQKPERAPLPREIDKPSPTTQKIEKTTTEDDPTIATFQKIKEFEQVEKQKSVSYPGPKPNEFEKMNVEDARQLEHQTRKQENPEVEAHAIEQSFKEFRESNEVQPQRETNRPSLTIPPASEEMKTQGIHQPGDQDKQHEISNVEAPVTTPNIKKDKEPKEVQLQRERETDEPGPKMFPSNEDMETREVHQPRVMPRKKDIPEEKAPPCVPASQELKEVQQQREIDRTNETKPSVVRKTMDEDSHQLGDEREKKYNSEAGAHAFVPTVQKAQKLEEFQPQREIDRPDSKEDTPEVKAALDIPASQEIKELKEGQQRQSDETALAEFDKIVDYDSRRLDDERQKQDNTEVKASAFVPTLQETQKVSEVQPQKEVDGQTPEVEAPLAAAASQKTNALREVPQQKETSRSGGSTLPKAGEIMDEDTHRVEDDRKKQDGPEVEASSFMPNTQKLEEIQPRREIDLPDFAILPKVEKMKAEENHQLEDHDREKDCSQVEAPAIRPTRQETYDHEKVQPQKENDRPNKTVSPAIDEVSTQDIHQLDDQSRKHDSPNGEAPSTLTTSEGTKENERAGSPREIGGPCRVTSPSIEELKPEDKHQLKDAKRKEDIPELVGSAYTQASQETQEHENFQPQRESDRPSSLSPPENEKMRTEGVNQHEDQAKKPGNSDVEIPAVLPTFRETHQKKEVQLLKGSDIPSQKTPTNIEELKSRDFHPKEYQKIEKREIDRSGPLTQPYIEEMKREDIHLPTDQMKKEEYLEPEGPTTMPTSQGTKEVKDVLPKKEVDRPSPTTSKLEKKKSEETYQPEDTRKKEDSGNEAPTTTQASQEINEREKVQLEREIDKKMPRILEMESTDNHERKHQAEQQEDPVFEAHAATPTFKEATEPKEDHMQRETTVSSPKMPTKAEKMKSKGTHQGDPPARKRDSLEMETPLKLEDVLHQGETDEKAVEEMKFEDTDPSKDRTRKQDANLSMQRGIEEEKCKIPMQGLPKKGHGADGQEEVKLETDHNGKDKESRPAREDMEVTQDTVLDTGIDNWVDTDEESVCADASHYTDEESAPADESYDTDEESACADESYDTDEESFYTDETEYSDECVYTDDSQEEPDEESICVERDFDEESICVDWEADECKYVDVEEEGTQEKPGLSSPVVVAGSALFVSIIVIVMRYIRTRKNKQSALH